MLFHLIHSENRQICPFVLVINNNNNKKNIPLSTDYMPLGCVDNPQVYAKYTEKESKIICVDLTGS